jgi:hypothetical protein
MLDLELFVLVAHAVIFIVILRSCQAAFLTEMCLARYSMIIPRFIRSTSVTPVHLSLSVKRTRLTNLNMSAAVTLNF